MQYEYAKQIDMSTTEKEMGCDAEDVPATNGSISWALPSPS